MITVREHEGSCAKQQALRLFGAGLSRESGEGEACLSFPMRGDTALYILVCKGGRNTEGGEGQHVPSRRLATFRYSQQARLSLVNSLDGALGKHRSTMNPKIQSLRSVHNLHISLCSSIGFSTGCIYFPVSLRIFK
jgi:hypothetical protein